MNIQCMLRKMKKNKYYVFTNGDDVHISLNNDNEGLNAFIDIYIDDDGFDSPFKNTEEAKLFGEIIVKLLEQVS